VERAWAGKIGKAEDDSDGGDKDSRLGGDESRVMNGGTAKWERAA
jgi:hypothetical protein